MAGFYGSYEHSIDAKGRLILPAKFRAPFERGGYLSQGETGCLSLWTPDAFDERMAELQALAKTNPAERNLVRLLAARTHEVDIDRQGRLPVPVRLREFARLEVEGPVLVTGAVDRVELWSPEVFQESVAGPQEERLLEGGVAAATG